MSPRSVWAPTTTRPSRQSPRPRAIRVRRLSSLTPPASTTVSAAASRIRRPRSNRRSMPVTGTSSASIPERKAPSHSTARRLPLLISTSSRAKSVTPPSSVPSPTGRVSSSRRLSKRPTRSTKSSPKCRDSTRNNPIQHKKRAAETRLSFLLSCFTFRHSA
jgi:hypothetical protein